MTSLSDVDRLALGAAAGRLRSALRCVVAASERHAVPAPTLLTEWPSVARRGGWARGRECDQAEDERLRELIEAGAYVVADLHGRSSRDPLVSLAESSFLRAAKGYLRTSTELHDARRSIALSDAGSGIALGEGASLLVASVERAAQLQESMPTVRLVPSGLVAAAHLLRDDLAAMDSSAAIGSAGHRQVARDLDGALAMIIEQCESLPASVVSAAEDAAGSLTIWDRATGSFRRDSAPLHPEHPAAPTLRAYAPDEPEAFRLALAEKSLAWRLDEVADRLSISPQERASDLNDAVNLFARESCELRDRGLAPATLPARDDVYRDHALGIAGGFQRLAGDCFDSLDLRDHDLGRSLLRARDAAVEYLAASEALAERVRREAGPGAPTFETAIIAAEEAWTSAHTALAGRNIGEVAVAEMAAARHDIVRARRENAARPAPTDGVSRLVGSLERRACQGVRWLLAGDAATQLALSGDGRDALLRLHAARHELEAAAGVCHPTPTLPASEHPGWLSDRDATHAHSGAVRVGEVLGRMRHGRIAGRDVRSVQDRGQSASW